MQYFYSNTFKKWFADVFDSGSGGAYTNVQKPDLKKLVKVSNFLNMSARSYGINYIYFEKDDIKLFFKNTETVYVRYKHSGCTTSLRIPFKYFITNKRFILSKESNVNNILDYVDDSLSHLKYEPDDIQKNMYKTVAYELSDEQRLIYILNGSNGKFKEVIENILSEQ